MVQKFESAQNLAYPADLKPEQITSINSRIEDAVKKSAYEESSNPDIASYEISNSERNIFNQFRDGVLGYLQKIECSDLCSLIPPVEDMVFYKYDNGSFKGQAIGAVDGAGKTLKFIIGPEMRLDTQEFLHMMAHEYGHILVQRVFDLDQNNEPQLKNLGFDRVDKTDIKNGESVTYSRGAFNESLAELFAFFCMDDVEFDYFSVESYRREFSFVLGLLEKLGGENNTTVKDEFKLLFSSNARRDYKWYTHLIDTMRRSYIEEGLNEFETVLPPEASIATLCIKPVVSILNQEIKAFNKANKNTGRNYSEVDPENIVGSLLYYKFDKKTEAITKVI